MDCAVCGGACCEGPIIREPIYPDADTRRWLQLRVTPHGGCAALSASGRCEIYEDRPHVCKVYPVGGPDCVATIKARRTPEQQAKIFAS